MLDFLFEVSSEAGNKVGGIYTVLQSKSSEMIKAFGNSYHLIGFYDESSARSEFEEVKVPGHISSAFRKLGKLGIKFYYGRWTHGNNAKLILIDAGEFMDRMEGDKKRVDRIKTDLWDRYRIDSLMMPWDFTLNVGWSYAAGMLIEELSRDKNVVAHFHEWISGAGLLYLKMQGSNVRTVFTTHATTLGRTKSAWEGNLMKEVSSGLSKGLSVNVEEAFKYKVEGKHLMEKVCASEAEVFTAVSEVVGKEAEYILGVKPDVITPNGLDFSRFGDAKASLASQEEKRKDVENFIYSYFLPYGDVDCKGALFIFISGRYEFENKGIDVFIDALGRLNGTSKRPVFAFIFVPSGVKGVRPDVTKNLLVFDKIIDNAKTLLRNKQDEVIFDDGKAIDKAKKFETVMRDEEISLIRAIADGSIKGHRWKGEKLVKDAVELFKGLKVEGDAPAGTFDMQDSSDLILGALAENSLDNSEKSRVKVIFYPTYVKPGDGLLNMEYYSAINAMDAGVFPSMYEPWGYTPVESAALMNVAVTSDLSGFGQFLLKNYGDMSKKGIKVVSMENKTKEEIASQLHRIMDGLSKSSNGELVGLKMDARETAEKVNWGDLIKHYKEAYGMAEAKK